MQTIGCCLALMTMQTTKQLWWHLLGRVASVGLDAPQSYLGLAHFGELGMQQ